MKKITGRLVAYCAVRVCLDYYRLLAQFNLDPFCFICISPMGSSHQGRAFYALYYYIVDLFDEDPEDEWSVETLAYLTK